MNKKLKPFGRFFVSGFVFVFILASLTFVSSTLPIQAYVESAPVVTSTVSPVHSSWSSKIGDFFKSIFGTKDKVVTPVVNNITNITNTTPPVVTPPTTTIIQQITKAGLTGNTGPQGLRGLTGLQGLKGDKGESGVNIDTSSLVTKSFFDNQVDRIYTSTSNSIQGLSTSLGKEVNTKLLTVIGDATIGGNLLTTGTILGSNISGTNTGDETLTSIKTKLGSATSLSDGYLTFADWNTFNGKQNALGYTPVNNTTTVNGHALSSNITVSASDVGLGNVINESKLTMFTSPTFTGVATADSLNATDKVTTRANLGLTLASNDEVKSTITPASFVTAWGDSLTAASYPSILSSLFGRTVYNKGVGAQTSTQIAIRQGGVQTTATIVGGTIPASGGVTVTFPSGYEPVNSQGPSSGVSGTISGVYGTVTYSGSTYTFTRSTSGSTVSIVSAPFIVDIGTLNNGIVIIWAGRNNLSNPTQIESDIAAMVSNLGSNANYFILSVTNASNEPSGSANYIAITSLNSYLASTYAGHYLDIRSYLVNNGLSDAGITPTAQDLTDIANDVIPTSLHSDITHLNAAGYTIVAQQVAKFIQNNFETETKTNNILTASNLSSIFASPMPIGTTKPNTGMFSFISTKQLTQQSNTLFESAPLGTEITDTNSWTATSGWTGNYATGFAHSAGVTTLSRTMPISSGALYQIVFTITGRTTGSFTVGLGGETSNVSYSTNGTYSYAPKTLNGTGDLIFTPATDFNGIISVISVKLISGTYNAIYNILDNTGISNIEIRSSLNALNNQFIGKNAGMYNTTGYKNTANGMYSLDFNTTGNNNTANGFQSLSANTTGYKNTANGASSLYSNTTGSYNTANGFQSLSANTTGINNTANGATSLNLNTTGNNNTANGYASLYFNTTGNNNTANGYFSLYSNTTGISNTTNGMNSLNSNTTGNYNTANGMNSLLSSGQTVTAGTFITGVSYTIISAGTTNFTALSAANNNVGTVFTSNGAGSGTGTAAANSNNNTAYGFQAGRYAGAGTTILSAPSNSLFLGYDTRASADGLTNENVIGYSAIGSGSNTITLGNNAITGTYFDGNIAKILGMNRHTTVNTAGNGLTLKSGGATLLATDKNGGDLTLSSGISTGTGSSNIHFFTGTASTTGTSDNAPTEKMTILGNGNVGVGMTPAYKLHIFENRADYAVAVINDGNVADRSGLLIQAGLDDNTVAGPSTLIGFKDGDATSIGSITFGSNAVAYNTTSDERLKTLVNNQTLSSLNVLNQIAIHDFTWNNDTSNDIYQGVFAQELYGIYPHAVTKPIKDSDYWMVDYSKLTPLIVKSVQELNLKVEDLAISNTIVGYENKTFIERFFGGLINWFADSANGIGKIFVKEVNTDKVNTKEICINGTCVTEAELLYIRNTMDEAGISDSVSTNEDKKIDNAENTDICPNIDGVQTEIPVGDEINTDGNCVVITGGDTGGTETSDTTAPVITLSGESSITLKVGDSYSEAGAIATDDVDTSVTVDISGTVDTAIAGTYTITYNAKDTAGNNATEVTRTVTVE